MRLGSLHRKFRPASSEALGLTARGSHDGNAERADSDRSRSPRVALRSRGLIRLMTRLAKLMGTDNMRMHDFRRGSRTASNLGILAATITLVAARSASADLMLDFANDRPDASTVPAYITFTGGGAFDATADINGVETTLQLGQSYLMSSLSNGVDVTEYKSGKVFVSLGVGLTDLTAAADYQPNFVAPGTPNFLTRFDKYEISYVGGSGGANLSSADFFGIPLQLQSTGGGPTASPKTLTWYNSNTASVFSGLGALANGTTDTSTDTSGAIVSGADKNGLTVTVNTNKGPETLTGVVRVIAPSSVNQGPGGTTPFPSLQNYLAHLQTGGPGSTPITATIAGANGQISDGGPFQDYNFTAYISNSVQTIDNNNTMVMVNVGDLVLDGNVTVSGKSQRITIVIQKQYLTDYAIYGANLLANATIVGGNPNMIVQKVLGDYFSGLTFGFIGSTEPNPNCSTNTYNCQGDTIGDSPSWTWYGNRPEGVDEPPKLALSNAYSAAQPNNPYYNQYAAYLNDNADGQVVTDSYGFAFTDRLAAPLASLDDNTTLTLTVLPDGDGLGGAPAPVPEPSTWAMLLLGFLGLGFAGRRALRKSEAHA